jgi:hypothetical protein
MQEPSTGLEIIYIGSKYKVLFNILPIAILKDVETDSRRLRTAGLNADQSSPTTETVSSLFGGAVAPRQRTATEQLPIATGNRV